jgi:carbon storage regulator
LLLRRDAYVEPCCKGRELIAMLVLRRKVGESIILDGVICVSVLAVEGERVKIGIDAPAHVTILREELLKMLSPEGAVEEETASSLD